MSMKKLLILSSLCAAGILTYLYICIFIPANFRYHQYNKLMLAAIDEIREGKRPGRTDGYAGFSIDHDLQKAGVLWIQELENKFYFCYYVDPVQSNGIIFCYHTIPASPIGGPGGRKYEVKLINHDSSGFWYSFVSD